MPNQDDRRLEIMNNDADKKREVKCNVQTHEIKVCIDRGSHVKQKEHTI